jgi:hypothetical protein
LLNRARSGASSFGNIFWPLDLLLEPCELVSDDLGRSDWFPSPRPNKDDVAIGGAALGDGDFSKYLDSFSLSLWNGSLSLWGGIVEEENKDEREPDISRNNSLA